MTVTGQKTDFNMIHWSNPEQVTIRNDGKDISFTSSFCELLELIENGCPFSRYQFSLIIQNRIIISRCHYPTVFVSLNGQPKSLMTHAVSDGTKVQKMNWIQATKYSLNCLVKQGFVFGSFVFCTGVAKQIIIYMKCPPCEKVFWEREGF